MDAQPKESLAAVPIPGEAAVKLEQEAQARMEQVSPHLLRVTQEVHKIMLWHEYAKFALGAIIQLEHTDVPDFQKAANRACGYADAMIEAIHQRKMLSQPQAEIPPIVAGRSDY